ncbi:FAD-binding protein [Croceicoccus bisphenolivorans]|uniref:FAD-binding protein n=1 Tax=Croceicoccus bisphenolivorans TaxID=1783232 RepID=UPI00082F131F|nr:FAD-binding protein [Croceicoccus bisphenolivorans]
MGDAPKMASRLSRRDFVIAGGAGVGVSMVAGAATPAISGSSVTTWDGEADILVIGSGAAASTAAITAHDLGASVMMLEKSPVLGGTTAKSGGGFWIANNFRMREKGLVDERIPFLQYVASYSFPHLFNPASKTMGLPANDFALLEAFYANGADMTDFLRRSGTLDIGPFFVMDPSQDGDGIPDYGPLDGWNKAPRGRCLGVRKPDGSPGFGAEMIRQFNVKFERIQLPRLTGHRVTAAIVDSDGGIIGVEATSGDRKLRFRGRKGVIFGTGGFAYNRELLNRHHLAPVFGGCGVPTNTGDFVGIAGTVGAQFGNMASAWRAQIVLEEALQYVTVPADIWSPPGDSMVMVNKYGRRAVNEKRNYQDRTRATLGYDANRWEFPNQLMFMLYDQRVADMWAGIHPIPDLPTGAPSIIVGATWDELADRLDERLAELAGDTGGVRLDSGFKNELANTLERFNRFAQSGQDEDFQRGNSPYEIETEPMYGLPRTNTRWGAAIGKNPSMFPMQAKGPYYAVILAPGVLDTNGGPVVNADAQVLRHDGQPIAGLYGAGNCIASPSHDAYWGMGGTLGPAMTFGYIAARHACGRGGSI